MRSRFRDAGLVEFDWRSLCLQDLVKLAERGRWSSMFDAFARVSLLWNRCWPIGLLAIVLWVREQLRPCVLDSAIGSLADGSFLYVSGLSIPHPVICGDRSLVCPSQPPGLHLKFSGIVGESRDGAWTDSYVRC